jgi:ATP-dependent Lon protease
MLPEAPRDLPNEIPLVAVRNQVIFPGSVVPLDVARPKSVAALAAVEASGTSLVTLFCQRESALDDPGFEDLHGVGCAARVLKTLQHTNGNYSVIVQGLARVRLVTLVATTPYLRAEIARMEDATVAEAAETARVRELAKRAIALMPALPQEASQLIDALQDSEALVNLVAATLDAATPEKQALLDADLHDRAALVITALERELDRLAAAATR